MLTMRWNRITPRDDQAMVEECLRTENSVQFCQIDGRWYSKVCVTVQGVRVANYYFEVLDNEHTNMLNSVISQCRGAWQRAAQEQLAAAQTAVQGIDQPEGGL
jgi:hypothetical protein